VNKLTIELSNGVIRQIDSPMPADTCEEICEWLGKPLLAKLGYSIEELDRCFDDDYIKNGE